MTPVLIEKNIFKSNVHWWVLLFCLISFPADAFHMSSDTLILDGEKIYIERSERNVNSDSLNESGSKDIISIDAPKVRGELQFNFGPTISFHSLTSNDTRFQSLHEFMGDSHPVSMGFALGLEAGIPVYTFKSNPAHQLGLRLGLQSQSSSIPCYAIDTELLNEDSIFALVPFNDKLYLQYFNIFNPGPPAIGEADTIEVPLTKNRTIIRSTEINIRGRYNYQPANQPFHWYFDAGVIYRRWQLVKDDYPWVLINDKGEYDTIIGHRLPLPSEITWITGVGMKYYFAGGCKPTAKGWDRLYCGAGLQCQAPFQLYKDIAYQQKTWSVALNLAIGIYF